MAKKGKKYVEAAKLVDRTQTYSVQEAIELVKKTNTTKFDATVEVAFRLGVDPKKADQQIPGTVTFDVQKAVNEIKAGKVEYRVDKAGNIHVPIGKVSFEESKLVENFTTNFETMVKAKPAAAKGTYMKNVAVTSTMGPGIKVDTASFSA